MSFANSVFNLILTKSLVGIAGFISITYIIYILIMASPGTMIVDITKVKTDEIKRLETGGIGYFMTKTTSDYVEWLGSVIQLDFGRSRFDNVSVNSKIITAAFYTFTLVAAALMISFVISISGGIISGFYPEKKLSIFLVKISDWFAAVPDVVLYSILSVFVAFKLGLFPISGCHSIEYGRETLSKTFSSFGAVFDFLHHLILPAVTLGISNGLTSKIFRIVRNDIESNLNQDFIETAILKGLSKSYILLHHVLRLTIIPINAQFWSTIPLFMGGMIIIEHCFSWSGLGVMIYYAAKDRDVPVLMGAVALMAMITVLCQIINDVTTYHLNPKLRSV